MSVAHHPSDGVIAQYAAGTLADGPSLVAAAHLERCGHCRAGHSQREARFQHEYHRVFNMLRDQFRIARDFQCLRIRTVRGPAIVQAERSRRETRIAGVMRALHQGEEFGDRVAMKSGWAKAVFRHQPARRQYHEIDIPARDIA